MTSTRSRCVIPIAVLAIVALGVAGCGGDDGGSALSAEEYRTTADKICKGFDDKIDALGAPTSPDEFGEFLSSGLDLSRDQLDQLKELNPPDDLKADHDEAMGLLGEQLDAIGEAVESIEGGTDPQEAITDATDEISGLESKAQELAEKLGLKECGS